MTTNHGFFQYYRMKLKKFLLRICHYRKEPNNTFFSSAFFEKRSHIHIRGADWRKVEVAVVKIAREFECVCVCVCVCVIERERERERERIKARSSVLRVQELNK